MTETHPELAVFDAQARMLDELLEELTPEDLDRTTRCPPLTAGGILAHVTAGLGRCIAAVQDATRRSPNRDRVTWWDYDPDVSGPRIIEEGMAGASERSAEELVEDWRDAWRDFVRAFGEVSPDTVAKREGDRRIRADELAATRVLEVGVHTMDIGHAANRGERLHPQAAEVIRGILDLRFDASLPRGLGWDARTYILTGTGRRRVEPNESHTLGPLSDRFPLIR